MKTDEPWIDIDDLVERTLVISERERERLIALERNGVLTVRPVALPAGKYLAGENHHLGWPVGIKAGNTLMCAYHRTLRHHGEGPHEDADSSRAMIVRSTDGGESWSDPIDVTQYGKSAEPLVLGFGSCFGLLNDKVFYATTYGLYVSEDEGKLWTHERVRLSDSIHPLEPTAIYHNGHLIFLSRNHTLPFGGHRTIRSPHRPVMMVSSTGWFPMTHQAITNISSYRWPDTTDMDFNPMTKRYEAVVTNRSGGALDNEQNETHEQTVNLWSISHENLYAGRAAKWRFEVTLLRLKSGMLDMKPENVDAAHPGGAVIDEEMGVQHIFIYCGRYSTPSGIYRITRDLDTPRLREG